MTRLIGEIAWHAGWLLLPALVLVILCDAIRRRTGVRPGLCLGLAICGWTLVDHSIAMVVARWPGILINGG